MSEKNLRNPEKDPGTRKLRDTKSLGAAAIAGAKKAERKEQVAKAAGRTALNGKKK
jgi:hypothetical protein